MSSYCRRVVLLRCRNNEARLEDLLQLGLIASLFKKHLKAKIIKARLKKIAPIFSLCSTLLNSWAQSGRGKQIFSYRIQFLRKAQAKATIKWIRFKGLLNLLYSAMLCSSVSLLHLSILLNSIYKKVFFQGVPVTFQCATGRHSFNIRPLTLLNLSALYLIVSMLFRLQSGSKTYAMSFKWIYCPVQTPLVLRISFTCLSSLY